MIQTEFSSVHLTPFLIFISIDAVLTFVNNDGIKIHTHMQSYLLKVGSNIGLNTFVIDENKLAMNGEVCLDFYATPSPPP